MPLLSEEQYRAYGNEILPGFLHLASHYEADDAAFLRKHKITHILNVAEECEPAAETKKICKVMRFELRDSPKTDIRSLFGQACTFLDTAKSSGGRALVHCFEGRNRSAAFVIAYVMQSKGLNLADALVFVKSKRQLVDPNIGFLKQLRDFEWSIYQCAPSMPFAEEMLCDLLDLEMMMESDLGYYTDVKVLRYEERTIDIAEVSVEKGPTGVQPLAQAKAKSKAKAKVKAKAEPKNVDVRQKIGLSTPEQGTQEEKEARVRECFEKADKNGDKVLSKDEFKRILLELPSCECSSKQIEALFKQIDTNDDGVITFDEFFDYLYPKMSQ